MQEYDELTEPASLCSFERPFKPIQLPFDQFPGVGFFRMVPVKDPASVIEIERTFEGETLGADNGIVLIGNEIVLQECQAESEAGNSF